MAAFSAGALAQTPKARIAIVIDDLGYSQRRDAPFIELDGPVALAFLPDGIYTPALARAATAAGKPVMLHAPMQATRNVDFRPRCHGSLVRHAPMRLQTSFGTLLHGDFEVNPDPRQDPDVAFIPACEAQKLMRAELSVEHNEYEFLAVFAAQLARVPGAIGVNNHEGSRLTQDATAMRWLMNSLSERGDLFFLDSRTSARSIAFETAQESGIPALKRDVFLDNVASYAAVNRRFDQLLRIAETHGQALAIGHPYRATIEVLKVRLRDLDRERFELVSPVELLPKRQPQSLQAAVPRTSPDRPARAAQSPHE